MTWGDAGFLAVGGALFGGGHLCLAEALRLAKAVVVAPFRYSPVVWALLLGYILWGDVPDTAMLSGTALVVASGLYIFHREATIRSNQESPH
jgi:drug/metabolite transporter (DMT)-like permease